MAVETPQSCSFPNVIAEALFSPAPGLRSFPARGANLCSTFHSHGICRMKIIKKWPISVPNIIWNLSSFLSYTDYTCSHSDTHTHTLDRTPLDQWSALRRDLYLTTHTLTTYRYSCLPTGFEPAARASESPQSHSLDLLATGIS